ncbi:MAG: hydroxymethylglutaryl-CoA reductase [Bifidobacterium tibiigranuli]|jgi:hydroxymethylglutaryl-CoA reductase|uniref:hydroxymethylglutaryl-CoA reductase n=1 Tax=Bifidobacterium tibiigranuli TaxID=2172043 RepID=UPI0026F01BCA|nr:hydroxymethylglutaryl-CoA reductase [Bifidobacterium tibiigranuli]MCI1674560.1 hydroxymethylglutaryl-CoA reductase [Bifidobacterium tibiigranuli]MCI1713022.1 hydroxymethylglutaryl-CoA reductase [Bifidobacterium tibiigranuli]
MTKFYELSTEERLDQLVADGLLSESDAVLLREGGLDTDIASRMVENHIGDFPVPLGLAEHFLIDGEQYLIPMATEEPSVIAAAGNAAQRIARSGGFHTNSTRGGITAQIVFRGGRSGGSVDAIYEDADGAGTTHVGAGGDISSSAILAEMNVAGNAVDARRAKGPWHDFLHAHIARISEIAQQAHPTLANHGGGLRSVSVRRTGDIGVVDHGTMHGGMLNHAGSYAGNDAKSIASNSVGTCTGEFIEFDLLIDPGAAMGANTVNTIAEAVSRYLADQLPQYELLMAILSNCAPQQRAKARACINAELLATKDMPGTQVAERIAAASRFAQMSELRAATHNKGIMNGINAVVLASGNDTRNVNAAAYADLSERHRTWTDWRFDGERLIGEIDMPMPIGSVGGAISTLPTAKLAMRLLRQPSAESLMGIIASVGLASNLSAMRALVTRGIQAGHMNLQLQSLAMMAGAQGDEAEELIRWLRANPRQASLAAAQEQLRRLRGE